MSRFLICTLLILTVLQGNAQSVSFIKSEFAPARSRTPQAKSSFEDVRFESKEIPAELFRDSYNHLPDKAFQAKLKAALDLGPLMFMRSFVNTYYADMSKNYSSNNLILCLGDAHPENFGFLKFSKDYRFVFNDIDDSGVCPIELDILRYFTIVKLTFPNKGIFDDLVKTYTLVINGQAAARTVPTELYPKKIASKMERSVKKSTKDSQFIASDRTEALQPDEFKDLKKNLETHPLFKKSKIQDIHFVKREAGGSGGLKRYWVLIFDNKTKSEQILELKELVEPGTHSGSWEQPLWSASERLDHLAKYIWGETPVQYGVLQWKETSYLIRTRDKDSIDLKDAEKKKLLQEYLRSQVGVLATYHKKFVIENVPDLESWISKNSDLVAKRYEESYKSLKKKH